MSFWVSSGPKGHLARSSLPEPSLGWALSRANYNSCRFQVQSQIQTCTQAPCEIQLPLSPRSFLRPGIWSTARPRTCLCVHVENNVKNQGMSPGRCGSGGWSILQYTEKLWAPSPIQAQTTRRSGCVREATHQCFSLSLPATPPILSL